MTWSNVRLIFCREVRDQLRDRRTLFMIAVLPILLYPLLGMSMFQVLQFVRERPTRVLVVGAEQLTSPPALIEKGRFAARWFRDPADARLLELELEEAQVGPPAEDPALVARTAVESGRFEAALYFRPGFRAALDALVASLRARGHARGSTSPDDKLVSVPQPEIFYNTADEKSKLTCDHRLQPILRRWTEEIGVRNLATSHLPATAVKPFEVAQTDVAKAENRNAGIWSKLLPFMLLIWALTGAFYPAVDLCAGEKERGTLETLLSSPAQRSEIVWGKLLTIMLFSVFTAVLNLLSVGFTGSFVMRLLPDLGPPPALTPLWLLIALLPMAALFSALCLALAAFARSSKEGQYYLMPLVLVTMPLMILPMAPSVELNLGNSLIPVTGVVLLLRAMLEGNYIEALRFLVPVLGVTVGCCLLAIRWAIDQFNSERVLFRESERLDFVLWLRHLLRDREDTPSVASAVLCAVLILAIQFFISFKVPKPHDFRQFAILTVVSQLAVIATPTLLMTIMLTRSPRKTLLLKMPSFWSLPAAVVLAMALHPAVMRLDDLVTRLYELDEGVNGFLASLMSDAPSIWHLILVLAIVPAVCEELAFRGFVLSGLRHMGHKWWAIALASFFFGITHGILQQSIVATLIGILIGYLAVQTGSLLPGVLYHMTHNALGILSSHLSDDCLLHYPALSWLVTKGADGRFSYNMTSVALGAVVVCALLAWFRSLPYAKSPEESLQDAINHSAGSVAA